MSGHLAPLSEANSNSGNRLIGLTPYIDWDATAAETGSFRDAVENTTGTNLMGKWHRLGWEMTNLAVASPQDGYRNAAGRPRRSW